VTQTNLHKPRLWDFTCPSRKRLEGNGYFTASRINYPSRDGARWKLYASARQEIDWYGYSTLTYFTPVEVDLPIDPAPGQPGYNRLCDQLRRGWNYIEQSAAAREEVWLR
jgi:hypothetical protein